jgi:hypothetical protein
VSPEPSKVEIEGIGILRNVVVAASYTTDSLAAGLVSSHQQQPSAASR